MKLHRRNFLHFAASAAALPALPRIARAQAYPSRPVKIIVPFAAGGATDLIARLLSQWLSERLGQSFTVENRPGGGSNIGTEGVLNAPPDGSTLLLVSTAAAVNATLYARLNFNLIRDLAPIASLFRGPLVMTVRPALAARTPSEFIAYAKANPGKLSMGSSGIGTSVHMSGELFKTMAKIDMVHVPYRGEAPALADLIGGQVQVVFPSMTAALEHIKAGTLRALGVTTAMRSELLPEVPSIAEFLPGYDLSQWYGLGAPRNTPFDIIATLNKEVNAALADARIKARFAEMGGTSLVGAPSDFAKVLVDETEKWGRIVRVSGATPE